MKTNKSLLIKVLTIVSALCLSMAMVFGLVGCGEDARSITKTEIIDGKLVVTYSDNTTETLGDVTGAAGAQGGTLAAGCTHEFVTNVYKLATCTQVGTDIQFCRKCKGYQLVETAINENLHGKYEWVKNEVTGISSFEFVSTEKVLPQDEFEVQNGACPKKECTACQKPLLQHRFDWVLADVNANACENEHLELYACLDCNAVVEDSRVSAANGHKYNKETAYVYKDGADYKVKLICDDCGEDTTVTAVYVDQVVANCGQGGYKNYTYTYNNFDFMTNPPADKNETVAIKLEEVGKTNAHKIGNLAIAQNSSYNYTLENEAELDSLIAANKIYWTEGQPTNCTESKAAGFFCEICSEKAGTNVLVTFSLYGKHNFTNGKVPATCTTDGKYECQNVGCAFEYTPAELLAKGHSYQYVPNTYSAGYIQVKCSCGATETAAVNSGVTHTATSCMDKSYTIYTTTVLTNGLPTTHPNYKLAKVEAKVESTEQKAHTLAEGLTFKQGVQYNYTDALDAQFEAGNIYWAEGAPGACNEYKPAGFFCTKCSTEDKKVLVTITLSGKHDFTGNTEVKGTAHCTDRVANTTYCNSCKQDIPTSYTGAKGHTYVANASQWTNFANNKLSTNSVVFTCACGDTQTLTGAYTYSDVKAGCVETHTDTYTFTYTYTIKNADNETVTVVFTEKKEFVASSGKHLIGELEFVQGQTNVQYNDKIDALVAANKIYWTEGAPATCSEFKTAGFFCDRCSTERPVLITIQLSGKHALENAPVQTHPADCDDAGYTYQVCATNPAHIIKIDDIPALGHQVVYQVVGNSAAANDALIPGSAIGTCNRPGCTAGQITVPGTISNKVEANCMKAGSVTFVYINNGVEVHAPITMTIPKLANHVPHNVGNPIEVKFDADGDGVDELYYFCTGCNGYVLVP